MRALLLVVALLISPLLAAAERVVSLAPSLSEIMLELNADDLLVGVLDGGERPEALAGLPSVGRLGQLEMESLLALQPTLVLLWPDSISQAQREQLTQFGIPVLVAQPRSLAQLSEWKAWPQLAAVHKGQLWGVPDKGLERPSFQMLGAIGKLCEVMGRATP